MTRRVRFDLPTSCDCGARGIVTFEETTSTSGRKATRIPLSSLWPGLSA